MSGIRISVEDLDTGETDSVELENDYLLVCDGDHYLDGVNRYSNGTTVLTVKRRAS